MAPARTSSTAVSSSGLLGVTYIPRDALAAVAEVANRPIVIDTETTIGYGATGGFGKSSLKRCRSGNAVMAANKLPPPSMERSRQARVSK